MDDSARGILFVCLGNICRSPLAEAIARQKFALAGLVLPVASAGTGDWHSGHGADARALAAGREHGYDLDAHRARQVQPADFERYDMLLAMDTDNLAHLQALRPVDSRARTALLLDAAGIGRDRVVPDPYFGDLAGFGTCVALLEEGIDGLVARLQGGVCAART